MGNRLANGAAIIAALSVSGCALTGAETAIRQTLPQVCRSASAAHVIFVAAIPFSNVSMRTIRAEAAAWRALEAPCKDPEGQNTGTVMIAAVAAYTAISAALREAESTQAGIISK